MSTLGSTAEPTDGQEWLGLNTTNHFAILVTLPAGGPWLITRVGAWLAGKDESCNFKLCVWTAAGTLAASSATQTAGSQSFALGHNTKYEADLTVPYEIAGGGQVYIGFARDPADNVQFGTRTSGSRLQKYSASWPSSLSGASSDPDSIGAYLVYESANQAPNAPVSLSPTGNAVVHSGTAPTVSGTRSDPDSGDYITKYQVAYYTDAEVFLGGNTIYDVSGAPTTFSKVISLPSAHAYYKWKARTWDKNGVAGPYSALQRFYANAVPATPGAPTVEGATLTPDISGSFSDAGDTLAAVQVEVTLDASPFTSKWASGDIAKSGSAWSTAYAGAALAWGTAYRARYRVKDSHGAYSSWSSWKSFTQTQPTGPTNLTPRTTNPRLSSLTPTLTVGHLANFRNDEVQVYTGPGTGTQLWYKTWDGSDYAGTASKARVYAGTALSYGGTYYWRARVELSSDGTLTDWSSWYPIRINATPNAPSGMSPTGGIVLTDTVPDLHMNFSDNDLDQGDSPSLVDVEVYNNATGVLAWSETGAAPAPADGYDHVTNPTALTAEVTYKWRARFTDAMGRQGAWSGYQLFKVSVAPTAAVSAPTDGATVTESTPTLDWTFASSGGKAQQSFQVVVYDVGPTGSNYTDEVPVYDTGIVLSSATQVDMPFGILENGHDYRWEVRVRDTDNLEYVLS